MTRWTGRAAQWGILAGLVAWGQPGNVAWAQDAGIAAEPTASGSGSSCVVLGNAYVQKDAELYDAATNGNKIGQFSGAIAPLKATNFPAETSGGRAQINTGAGFRVEGFADPRAMLVFATRDLPVAADRLWISGGIPLKIVGAAPGKLRVELAPEAGLSQAIQGWAPCDAVTFTKGTLPLYEVPGNARGYVAKTSRLDLYESHGGSAVSSLSVAGDGSGLLLWGTERKNGYAHVTSRSTVFIDAWVKLSDVRALPRGEMMDQATLPDRLQDPPKLGLQSFLREMRAPSEAALYAGRGATFPMIGVIERDADIYVLETVVGWASVLPKGLHVMPIGDRAFWVKASDLGLVPPGADAGAEGGTK